MLPLGCLPLRGREGVILMTGGDIGGSSGTGDFYRAKKKGILTPSGSSILVFLTTRHTAGHTCH